MVVIAAAVVVCNQSNSINLQVFTFLHALGERLREVNEAMEMRNELNEFSSLSLSLCKHFWACR